MAKAVRGRNLFAIDHTSIEATLTEANQPLIKRRDKLLRAFEAIPPSLDTYEQVEAAQDFAREVEELLGEAKRARLSDGRPFTEAAKTVKDFFARIEGPLGSTLDALMARVTEAALRQRRLAEAEAREQARKAPSLALVPPVAAPLGTSRGGDPVVTKVEDPAREIPLVWVVEAVDRDRIDLEELRPYLTESALLTACRKHLDAHGPNKLAGVEYQQVAG